MPQAGIISRKIGSVGSTFGKFKFARDGDLIGLINFHRFVRPGAAPKTEQGPYLGLRVGMDQILKTSSNPGWGVLINSSLLPQPLSDQIAAQGERFATAFDDHCRWLLFLPGIEAQGEPVAGFELSMAETTAEETGTFLRGIDPAIGKMLRPDIDRTFFLNPHFIETNPRAEEFWVSTLGFLTGQVMMNYSRETTGG